MSDQQGETTPDQETAVRRLLAEARVTEPLPADLAARLDGVLVGLGEEREGSPPVQAGHTAALASRRRRASILLVAAAAVVAIGVGIGQVVGDQSATEGSSSDAGAGTDGGGNLLGEDRPNAAQDRAEAAPDEPGSLPPGSPSSPPLTTTVGRVRADSFTSDVRELRRALPVNAADAVRGEFVQPDADRLPSGFLFTERAFDCAPAPWGPGVLVPVYFEGSPGVLAYRPVTGEIQVVHLVQCGTGETLRSTTLQAD